VSYVIDRPIQQFIEEERERCAALAKKLAQGSDADFLAYCIENAIAVTDDLAHWRKRFGEVSGDSGEDDLDFLS